MAADFDVLIVGAGMVGISLALALTLTDAVFSAEVVQELRLMTFGVVLFTLLVQGTTIEPLIRRLKLAEKSPQQLQHQRRQALLYAKRAGKRELDRLREEGILFRDIWEAMSAVYDDDIAYQKSHLRNHLEEFPELEQEMFLQARADVLKAERSAISDANRRGFISEKVYHDLSVELNDRLAALDVLKANRGLEADGHRETKDE